MYSFQDVDVVVATPGWGQEELKRRMAAHNSSFFTVAAKTPGATYRVLKHRNSTPSTFSYMRSSGYSSLSGYGRSYGAEVKVDVLIANVTLNIPGVPAERIKNIDGYPACPLALLVLLRLQAWDHHRVELVRHLREKAHVDYRDLVYHLLPYAGSFDWSQVQASSLAKKRTLMADGDAYLPASFMRTSRRRVREFCELYREAKGAWASLGADASRTASTSGRAAALGTRRVTTVTELERMLARVELE